MNLGLISELTIEKINELVFIKGLVENQTIEFKKQISEKKGRLDTNEFAKDVTAFANSKGGYLFIGIDENPKGICGMHSYLGNQKIQDWIANVLNDLVDQTLDYDLHEIPISDNSELSIFIIEVPEGNNKPYFVVNNKKHISYIRKGTSIFESKPSDLDKMYHSRQESLRSGVNIRQQAKGKSIKQIGQVINTNEIKKVTEVQYDPEKYVSDEQAKKIKDKVDEIVRINELAGKLTSKSSTGQLYAKTWNSIYKRYSITKYTLLSKVDFDDCINWLQKQIAGIHVPKLRRNDNPTWRKKRDTGIFARINELGMSKAELYQFAFERLSLKTPIFSISELKEQNLDKLYKLIRAKKTHNILIKVFLKGNNIYGIYSDGKERQYTFLGIDSKPLLVKLKSVVVFLRSEKAWSFNSKREYTKYKLMSLQIHSLEERILTDQKPFPDGQDRSFELLSPRNLTISPDQTKVLFVIEKYATGSELVQVDIESGKFEELFSAEKFEFIKSGIYKGQLLVGVSEIGDRGRDIYYKVTDLKGDVLKSFNGYEDYMTFRSSALVHI